MNGNAWQLIVQAGWFVKVVLGILAGLSIGSWTVILHKLVTLRAAERQTTALLSTFQAHADAARKLEAARAAPMSPLARVFQAVHAAKTAKSPGTVERLVKHQMTRESARLYAYLTFLASTGSTAPFIGLLGTVWGIMEAFRGIGSAGSASLAVVAPAIAEALIATAAGLLAAIPAVMAYNYFLNRIQNLLAELEDFSETLLAEARQAA